MTPKMLTCVLVDDEQSNLDVLITYVNQIPYLVLKGVNHSEMKKHDTMRDIYNDIFDGSRGDLFFQTPRR